MTVEEELQGGIKNALEKGVPMEKILQTFLNAGYPSQAVQAAAKAVTEGATTIMAPSPVKVPLSAQIPLSAKPAQTPVPAPVPIAEVPTPIQSSPQQNSPPSEGISKTKIIILSGILLILLILLGASLIFREELINFLS